MDELKNTYVWSYNGGEYPFDISESESMKRMEVGLSALRKRNEEIGVGGGEALREQCMMIREFFDTVLGEGMGSAVCGEAYSSSAHTMAYMEFILFVNAQVRAFREAVSAVEERYRARAAGTCGA